MYFLAFFHFSITAATACAVRIQLKEPWKRYVFFGIPVLSFAGTFREKTMSVNLLFRTPGTLLKAALSCIGNLHESKGCPGVKNKSEK